MPAKNMKCASVSVLDWLSKRSPSAKTSKHRRAVTRSSSKPLLLWWPRAAIRLRASRVLLRARARMHGDGVHALALGQPRDLGRVHAAVVPAAADLDGEGAGDGLAQRAEDHGGAQRIAHQRRALALGDDLRHRATHVE